ncbi:MAG TPA: hypothetical protein VJR89_12415, partial [Polyangiales bacterium]|nr:hypothetical protein [Polyangiales bacterium]
NLPPAEPIEPALAAWLPSGELVAGGVRGLEGVRFDGSGSRPISPGPALHPRRFGPDHVVALRPLVGPDLRDGAALELIALGSGERRELARLPEFRCADAERPHALHVIEGADFSVHGAQHAACIGLSDGGQSSLHVRVRARVDLHSREVARWLVVGEPECVPPAGVESGDPNYDGACWNIPPVARISIDPAAFPFGFHEEHVTLPAASRKAKLRLRGYQLEQPSPSGRWLLLSGDFVQREYTLRRFVLLDRNDGKLYPLAAHGGGWPAALSPAGSHYATPVPKAASFTGETVPRWIGDSAASELLVIDSLLVRPGERSFEIPDAELAQ